MKNIFRLGVIFFLLSYTSSASGQTNPGALLLDSVYSFSWVSNNWSLNLKNYRLKNGSGQTTQSLYKKYNTGSGQFLDYARFLYNYTDTTPVPTTITNQFWYSNIWNTYQYTHYLAKDIIDTSFSKIWDNQQHIFISGIRNVIQYNDSLLPVEKTTQGWDITNLDWLNSTRTSYSYTAIMQPSEQIILSWQNSTSTWENVYKYSNVYDLNNVLVSQLEYAWDDTAVNWASTFRITYFNNPTSMPYLSVKEFWNSSLLEWDSLEQSTYIYNQYNWLMTIRKQNYQQDQGTWIDSYLTYYTYSIYGIQQTMTGNVWDTINLTWIPDVYQGVDSASQKLAEAYNRYVNPATFLITGGIRNLYTYDSRGDTLSKVNQEWNVSGNDWANKTQVLYSYDSHNLLTEDLTQDWSDAGSSWVNAKKSDYYYSEFIGIDEHTSKVKPCFYANPMVAGNSIYCPEFRPGNEYTLRICSLSGTEVYRIDFRGGESVMISKSLTSGLYFLIIEENHAILYKDKVVILH